MNGKKNIFNITILGSGTCVPSLTRSSCSVLAEVSGSKLLFDIGAGTIRRLLETGTPIHDISHIFLSHHHPDHTGELASYLFASKYPQMKRTGNPLTIVAGKGFSGFFNRLKAVYGEWVDLGGEAFKITELDTTGPDRVDLGGFCVKTIPVDHREESLAYRIECSGKSFVYSGDTDYCEALVSISEDADLLVCECSTPDRLKMDKHLTPSLAGSIAAQAGVKHLVLTHFYPECEKTDIAKECRKTYDGRLALAEDLMEFSLQ